MDQYQIVIVGGCAAGFSAAASAAAISRHHSRDRLLLIDAEGRLPYKRTKVSKSFAAGFERDEFRLEDRGWYDANGVDLLTGRRVVSVIPENQTLELDDGRRLGWEKMILATGARPRRPSFAPEVLERLHFPVTAAASERLRLEALETQTVLVVGMGVLGVETVDQLKRMGKHVTFVGLRSSIMSNELNAVAFGHLEKVLLDADVELLFDEEVLDITLGGGKLAVTFSRTGESRSFDTVVYGIGVEPDTTLASAAGLEVECGVLVNEQLRTSHPNILAAGDVAQHPDGRVTHLWRHAEHQGRTAGVNAAGGSEAYRFVPFRLKCSLLDHYFFSVGRPDPQDLEDYQVVEHTFGRRYLCAYYRENHLKGLIMMNDEERQKRYLQAVIEGWSRKSFEETFV